MARLNYSAMNDNAVANFGAFIGALKGIEAINAKYREDKKALEVSLSETLEARKVALASGMDRDKAVATHDVAPIMAKIATLDAWKKTALVPFTAERDRQILSILATDEERANWESSKKIPELKIAQAYALSVEPNKSADSTGTYTVQKGKKTETVKVEVSFKEQVKALYERLGICADKAQALNKSVSELVSMAGGMRRANTDEGFLRAKSARNFNEDLCRALCRQMIICNSAFTFNAQTGTVERVQF